MHLFKFTQAQAAHLTPDEFEHYAELGLIRGVGPNMTEVLGRYANRVTDLEGELTHAQEELERAPTECGECGAAL